MKKAPPHSSPRKRRCRSGLVRVIPVLFLPMVQLGVLAQGFDQPISDTLVQASLVLPDGEVATVAIADGTKVEIHDSQDDLHLALAPIVSTHVPGEVHWVPLEIVSTSSGSKLVPAGLPTRVGVGQSLPISLAIGASQSVGFTVYGVNLEEGGDGSAVCCVTCGRWTVCAASVDLYCDSCVAQLQQNP